MSFLLQVEFFKQTMAFSKIKWSKKAVDVPESKMCILKFLEKHSDKDGYLVPLKIKSWFQGLIDTFCLNKPMIRGINQVC